MAEKDKGNPLELALAQIEKQFGKGAIMRLGDNEVQKVEAISTGCLTLDIALGIGGIPKGRIVEIYGPESSGKTTVALHIVAEVQKAGGTAAFIDAEHALDPSYASRLGVQLETSTSPSPTRRAGARHSRNAGQKRRDRHRRRGLGRGTHSAGGN